MEQAAERGPVRLPCGCVVGPQPHYCEGAREMLRERWACNDQRDWLGAHRVQIKLSAHRLTDAEASVTPVLLRPVVEVRDPVTWRDRL